MSESNLFENTDLSLSEQDKLSRSYHRGERLDETKLIDKTVTQYVSILVSAAVVVLIGHLVGSLPLLAFFGVSLVLVSLFGGKFLDLIQDTKEITPNAKSGAELDVRQAFVDACNKQNVDPNKYLLLVSDSESGVAFAFPLSLNPTIVVATNLLENCTPEELTSILSHEIDHHKAGFFMNFLFVYLNASLFAIGGAIMWFTDLPTTEVFILLASYGIVTKILGNVLGHILEKRADAAVSQENRLDFVRGLVKMQKTSYHVEGKIGTITHMLFDEHPPLNHRIESALGTKLNNEALEDEHIEGGMSPILLIGSIIGTSIGTVLIAFGIVNMITSGVGVTLIGLGGIVTMSTNMIMNIPDIGFKKSIATTGLILTFIFGLGYFVGSTTDPLAAIGWGIMGAITGIFSLAAIIVGGALIISIFSDSDDLEVPVMKSDPYDKGDGIDIEDIKESVITDDSPLNDINPEEITGDDVIVGEDPDNHSEEKQ